MGRDDRLRYTAAMLMVSVFKKLKVRGNEFSIEERDYLNVIFDMNLRMHRDLIGGQKSTDALCL